MKYPIAIELGGPQKEWRVVVPDLPACVSAAESGIDEAIENAKHAIERWIETALDLGKQIPPPSSIGSLQAKREYKGWVWAVVEIDPALLSDEIERVNITLPRRILARLDESARALGKTRSGYISELALRAGSKF